jgi:hypothetical protein
MDKMLGYQGGDKARPTEAAQYRQLLKFSRNIFEDSRSILAQRVDHEAEKVKHQRTFRSG